MGVAVSPLAYIRTNPVKPIRTDKVTDVPVRYVCPEEFGAMLGACDTLEAGRALWWRGFLSCCYATGLRLNEAVHLCWADVDFEAETVRVSAKSHGPQTLEWSPKDAEMRVIPAPPQTMALLVELQERSPAGFAYVFLERKRFRFIRDAMAAGRWREGQSTLNDFHKQMRKLVVLAAQERPSLLDGEGKPAVSVHDLRRSAVTNWSKVTNIQTVMQLAGHTNVATTQKYYAATTDDQLELARMASRAAMQFSARSAQSDPKKTQRGKTTETLDAPDSGKPIADKAIARGGIRTPTGFPTGS